MVGDVDTCLPTLMQHLGIKLNRQEQKMNIRPLIGLICRRFFGDFNCTILYINNNAHSNFFLIILAFVDLAINNFKSPIDCGPLKVQQCYTGNAESKLATDVAKCDPNVWLKFGLPMFYSEFIDIDFKLRFIIQS